MTINEWMRMNKPAVIYLYQDGPHYQEHRERLVCNDGFSISVQASQYHYCNPRKDGLDYYTSVELGYPNREEELLSEFAEDPDRLTHTVYGYVPVKVVDEIIRKHQGIKIE